MHVPRYRSDDDRRIVRQAEVLGALSLRPDGRLLHFDFIAAGSQPRHVAGTIDDSGGITLEHDDATTFPPRGGCPICLAATDRIATPRGQLLVTDLHRGALVWTLDASGRRVAAPVLRVGSVAAPPGPRSPRALEGATAGRPLQQPDDDPEDQQRVHDVQGGHRAQQAARGHVVWRQQQ